MPVNKTDAEKHREVQDQKIYRETCRICGREYYTSLISRCPERDRNICMYCCRMCENSYASPLGGRACRVKDAERKKGKRIATAAEPPRNDGKERTA